MLFRIGFGNREHTVNEVVERSDSLLHRSGYVRSEMYQWLSMIVLWLLTGERRQCPLKETSAIRI